MSKGQYTAQVDFKITVVADDPVLLRQRIVGLVEALRDLGVEIEVHENSPSLTNPE
jgi:hypothetical protein